MKKIKYLLATISILLTQISFAQTSGKTLADVADRLVPQLGNGVWPAIMAFSYIFGIAFGFKAALKLKEYNESKGQQVKLQTPIMFFIASAMFLALPTFINVGVTTFGFDKGGQSTFKF